MIIGIVGLGLIGGSLAKSLKKKTAHTVYGRDINPETMLLAVKEGAADKELVPELLRGCDIIIAALPPKALVRWIKENAPFIKKGAVLVDVCGVKRYIVRHAAPLAQEFGFTFIGGHPMAGRERGGFENASENLFDGSSMILTPDSSAPKDALDTLRELFLSIGFGTITLTDPENHDRNIAYTSQLCHIASNAFIKSPRALTHKGYSAGSFKDLTRVAKLDENMWTELFMANRDFIADELRGYIGHLNAYLEALDGADPDKLRALLKEGRELKEKTSN